ncbi:MAG: cysteine desulfurase family protein [Acholeplasmataceae bacterium]
MKTIYLDHAATTPVDPRVLKAMQPYFCAHYGNPSSMHHLGIHNKKAINTARKTISTLLACQPEEIIFTSGGTESINLALKGVAQANPLKKEIITTKVEHKATLNACKFLENNGYKVHYLATDAMGLIDLTELDSIINAHTLMISIIWGNNEIGTIQDIKKIIDICHKNDVLVHVDGVQIIGQIPFDLKTYPVDLMTISAHKFYGPKGSGLLYVKKNTPISAIIHGGDHENGYRSGTENLMGIIGLVKAMELAYSDIKKQENHKRELSTYFYKEIKEMHDVILNGPMIGDQRLPGHLSLSFKEIDGFQLSFALDQRGVCVSTGSACSARIIEPSHVLKAIKVDPDYIKGTLRITFGNHQNLSDVKAALKVFKDALACQ